MLADVLARTPVIVAAHTSDVWQSGLHRLMTGIAAAAIIASPACTYLWLGLDSLAVALLSRVA